MSNPDHPRGDWMDSTCHDNGDPVLWEDYQACQARGRDGEDNGTGKAIDTDGVHNNFRSNDRDGLWITIANRQWEDIANGRQTIDSI